MAAMLTVRIVSVKRKEAHLMCYKKEHVPT
jgi:hypothetical protein